MTRRTALVGVALGVVLLALSRAGAQEPTYPPNGPTPTPRPTPTATPAASCRTKNAGGAADTTFARGERLFVEGSGLGRLDVEILFDNRTRIGSGRPDRNTESFSIAAEIPDNAAGGAHTIVARGAGNRSATCNITVSGGGGLPRTGADMAALASWGAMLVGGGTGLAAFAARRRRAGARGGMAPYTWTEEDVLWANEWREVWR